jgi:NADH-quinone oxidoreductase subunit G/NADP-reducing hydrogenase subunit HndD
VFIDGTPVEVPEGATILEAARRASVLLPTLCDHPGLARRAFCRLCVVECDGSRRLRAACSTEVWEGLRVVTHSPELIRLRKTTLALLLEGHPKDCLACPRSLSCELQDMATRLGVRERGEGGAAAPAPVGDSGALVRDMAKCIKCGRCVAACQGELGAGAIATMGRGLGFEIGTPYGAGLSEGPCVFCGACASVCPVAAFRQEDGLAPLLGALGGDGPPPEIALSAGAALGLEEGLGLPPGSLAGDALERLFLRLGFGGVGGLGLYGSLSALAEASELLQRLEGGGGPLVSGCGTAWQGFLGSSHPGALPLLSRALCPEAAFARLRGGEGVGPGRPFLVAGAPCLARKFEARGLGPHGDPGRFLAATTRELLDLARLSGLMPSMLAAPGLGLPGPAPGGGGPAAAPGDAGGGPVTELLSLARAIHSLRKAGEDGRTAPDGASHRPAVGLTVPFRGRDLRLHLAFGLKEGGEALRGVLSGESGIPYLKVMSCPGGCLEGGGQALPTILRLRTLRKDNPGRPRPGPVTAPLPDEGEALRLFGALGPLGPGHPLFYS